MATGSTAWSTVYEALEATGLPHEDLMRLADEGLLRTSRPGRVLLFRTDDVERLAATGSALGSSTTSIEDLRPLGRSDRTARRPGRSAAPTGPRRRSRQPRDGSAPPT